MSLVESLFSPGRKAVREGIDAARIQVAKDMAPATESLAKEVSGAQARYKAHQLKSGIGSGLRSLRHKVTGSSSSLASKMRHEMSVARSEQPFKKEFEGLHNAENKIVADSEGKMQQAVDELAYKHRHTDLKHRAKLVAGVGAAGLIASSMPSRSSQISQGY